MTSLFNFILNVIADTLSQAYADQWAGADEVSGIMRFMTSNDLILVVLAVSLAIWFVILFFLFRIEKKLKTLESISNSN